MRPTPHPALYFSLLMGRSVLAHIPKHRNTGPFNARPHTLHPTVHPALDLTDPGHLLLSEGTSLHYHDPHGGSVLSTTLAVY
jgi:hypothetical protein